jgi:hypothetical protein
MALVVTGKNRIMIYGPTDDGSYVVEFMTADGDVLSISIPRSEAATSGHGDRSAIGRSRMPIARRRRMKASP